MKKFFSILLLLCISTATAQELRRLNDPQSKARNSAGSVYGETLRQRLKPHELQVLRANINGPIALQQTPGAIDKGDGSIEYHFAQVTVAINLVTNKVSLRNSGESGSKTPYLVFSLENCREALEYKRSSPRTESPHRAPYHRLPERITTEKPSYDQDDSMQ